MMPIPEWNIFLVFVAAIMVMFVAGIYCIIVTRNLMRAIIGVEILMKGVTLFIIIAGYVTGNRALAQGFVVTLIVIEVAVIATMCGIVIGVFRHTGSLDSRSIGALKG